MQYNVHFSRSINCHRMVETPSTYTNLPPAPIGAGDGGSACELIICCSRTSSSSNSSRPAPSRAQGQIQFLSCSRTASICTFFCLPPPPFLPQPFSLFRFVPRRVFSPISKRSTVTTDRAPYAQISGEKKLLFFEVKGSVPLSPYLSSSSSSSFP